MVRASATFDLLTSSPLAFVSQADVSKQLKVSISTAHRYLTKLEELDVVKRDIIVSFAMRHKLIELAGAFLVEHRRTLLGEN